MTQPVSKTPPAASVSVGGKGPPGNRWMRKAWEECVRAMPILSAMGVVVTVAVVWGLGVDRFIRGHDLMIQAEKAKIVLELNHRYVKQETLDATIAARDALSARIKAMEKWQDDWVRFGRLPDDVQQNTDIQHLKKDVADLDDWRDMVSVWMLETGRSRGNPE